MLRLDFATPADMALCRQMIKQGSKSFHLASLLLPTRYREHARCLYGFCRMADDLVDDSDQPGRAVSDLQMRLDQIYAGNPGSHPTDRAFADVALRFGIPREVPEALIEGFLWDAQGRHYETLSDVTAYAVRVAGTVGVMMSLIMGQRDPRALARAIDLGIAMQFSNIARDVVEDEALGRVYLPGALLQELGGREAVAGLLVERAEGLYERAVSGIALLPKSCRASINAARLLYREIGLEAVRIGHASRAIVSTQKKLGCVVKAVAQAPGIFDRDNSPCADEARFLLDAVLRTTPAAKADTSIDGRIGWVFQMFETVSARRP